MPLLRARMIHIYRREYQCHTRGEVPRVFVRPGYGRRDLEKHKPLDREGDTELADKQHKLAGGHPS